MLFEMYFQVDSEDYRPFCRYKTWGWFVAWAVLLASAALGLLDLRKGMIGAAVLMAVFALFAGVRAVYAKQRCIAAAVGSYQENLQQENWIRLQFYPDFLQYHCRGIAHRFSYSRLRHWEVSGNTAALWLGESLRTGQLLCVPLDSFVQGSREGWENFLREKGYSVMPLPSDAGAEEKPLYTFSVRIPWKTAWKALRNLSGKSRGKGSILLWVLVMPFLVMEMIAFLAYTVRLLVGDITLPVLLAANLIWTDCVWLGGFAWWLSAPWRWRRKLEAPALEMDWCFYREHCVAGSERGQTVYPYTALSSLKKVQNGYAVTFSGERKWVGLIFPDSAQKQERTDWWQFMNRKLAENAERRMEASREKLQQIQAQNAQEICQAEVLREFRIQGLLTGRYVWEACRALNPVTRKVRSELRFAAVMAIAITFVAGRGLDPQWKDFAFVLLGIGILLAAFCLWMGFPLGEIRRRMAGYHLFRKDQRTWHFQQEECVETVGKKERRLSYQSFVRWITTEHLFILLGPPDSGVAFLIPKRAIPSEERKYFRLFIFEKCQHVRR